MRVFTLILSLVLPLAAAACGSTPGDEEGSAAPTVTAESEAASLKIPARAPAGSSFPVAWTGPGGQNDYITIVEKGAPKGAYKGYTYSREGSPLELTASDTPGEFEVRYVAGDSKDILVSAAIQVTEVQATLEAPDEVGAGSAFSVTWTGPANKNDYVTVVESGAPQGAYKSYKYTRDGSPLELAVPDAPGDFEVRYVMGQSKRILQSRPIKVNPVTAALEVPQQTMVESSIEVRWTGPDNNNDYITIVESGAPEGTYKTYTYTREGSPLQVATPKAPGRYEVRYVTGQSKRVLASSPLTVKPLGATLKAPEQVAAREALQVTWEGPNNERDFIAISREGVAATAYESRAYSRAGNPAELFAPSAAGNYEIRYVMAAGNRILEAIPIRVVEPED